MKKHLLISALHIALFLIAVPAAYGQDARWAIDAGSYSTDFEYSDTQDTRDVGEVFPGHWNASTRAVLYKLELKRPMTIEISHCGSVVEDTYIEIFGSYNGTLSSCTASDTNQCDDPCPPTTASIRYDLYIGTYYVASRAKRESGMITTRIKGTPKGFVDLGHFSDYFIHTQSVDTWGTSDFYRPHHWGNLESPNDMTYQLTIDTPMRLEVSNQSSFNSSFYIDIDKGYADFSPSLLDQWQGGIPGNPPFVLPTGTYQVVAEGNMEYVSGKLVIRNGLITTTIEGFPGRLEIPLEEFFSEERRTIVGNTARASSVYGNPATKDIYYRITLDRDMGFSVSLNEESSLRDLNLYLLDDKEKLLTASVNSELQMDELPKGDYYLVVEGKTADGNIALDVRTLPCVTIVDLGQITDTKTLNITNEDSYIRYKVELAQNFAFSIAEIENSATIKTTLRLWNAEKELLGETNSQKLEKNIPAGIYYFEVRREYGSYPIKLEMKANRKRVVVDLGLVMENLDFKDCFDTEKDGIHTIGETTYEVWYRFELTVTASSVFIQNHCDPSYPGYADAPQDFATRAYLFSEAKGFLTDMGIDGSLGFTTYRLPPGVYYVVAEGATRNMRIETEIRIAANPYGRVIVDLGTVTENTVFKESFDTGEYGVNAYGETTRDVFYQFEIKEGTSSIFIRNHCDPSYPGYADAPQDFVTRAHLLNDDMALFSDTRADGSVGFTASHLPPGIYYVIAEGATRDMRIETEICIEFDLDQSSLEHNYVFTRHYTKENREDSRREVTYFDGLGAPTQHIWVSDSPLLNDLVDYQEYDDVGRESTQWLPRISAGKGALLSLEAFKSLPLDLYGNDLAPCDDPIYEASPLNRVAEEYGAGEAWRTNKRSTKKAYLTNRIEDPLLNCVRYDVSLLRDTVLQIQTQGVYASGKLYVTRTTDEDGNIGLDFQDKSGRLLLTRRVNREDGQQKAYDTYYIYDDWGDQCVVLPPMASGQMRVGTYESGGSAALRDYAYLYQYDARHRVIAKKLPGCDWTFFVYDRNNRLIFSQDGNQRQRGEWSFSIPDLTGRECFSGICRNGLRPFSAPLDDTVISASWYSYFPSTSSAGAGIYKGYYIVGVSLISSTVLSVNYYDDYSFLGKNGLPKETDASACYDPSVEAEGFGKRYTSNPRGLLTGTLAAQLDGSSTPAYLYSVMYYDAKGRMVQAKSSNQLSGGRDKEYIGYNFTGQPTKRKLIHSATGKPTQTELYAYTYDHAGRPLTTTHQLNGGEVMTLADNEYDELGRLVANKRNGNDSLRTDYGYNVRSWMKSISGPLFSQTLYYNDARPDGSNDPCYNGDISAMDWQVTRTGDNKRRGYNFTYDNLSRLTVADYLEGGVLSDKFSTDYSYDEHDNILSLRRHGNTGTTTYGLVDDVTFTYHGNQLVKASDAGKEATLSMSRDFKNSANMDVEYAYDASGNMTMDTNNGIYSIAYNVLNLPEKVTFAGNGDIMNEYVYSANGRKLSVAHRNAGGTKRTNYVGNLVYENDSLDMILVDGGYVKDGQYHFYFQDHLGSNRVVADAKGNVEQANHYYPYGTPFAESYNPDKQSRKYIGKEYDTENGLDWYDFEARFMDGTRFTTMDPLAELYYSISPYSYCGGNPIKRLDPDGRKWKNDSDAKYAKELTKELRKKADAEQKKVERLNKKIEKRKAKGKNVSKLQSKVDERQDNINNLEGGIAELEEMGNTQEQVFTYGKAENNVGYTYIDEDGVITMDIVGDGSAANGIHESSHGYDIWKQGWPQNLVARMDGEVKAYQRQYSFDESSMPVSIFGGAKSLSGIDYPWIYGIRDSQGKFVYVESLKPGMKNVKRFVKSLKER